MTELELRTKIVNQAKSFIGCKEKDGSFKKIIDTYNSHKPLARGYKVKYTDEWCATFVSAIAILCKVTDIMFTECSCAKMVELYKNKGKWQETDSYVPKAGDIIMYDWEDNGKGDNTGRPNHVGIVSGVTGSVITVIEGNFNESVRYRTINVNAKYIRGYCLPNYSSKADTTPVNKVDPNKVKAPANKDKLSLFGTYKVANCSWLNVRNDAGTNKTSVLTTIPKDSKVEFIGYSVSNGVKWYCLLFEYEGYIYVGYVNSKYLVKV